MGPTSDNDGAVPFEPIHPVAQSYLGTLWIAADKRDGGQGKLALLRRVRLPEGTPPDVRQAIARAALDAQRLEHENVLSVLDVLDAGAELGIAYEYVDAEPLRTLQSAAAGSGLAFPIAVSLRIGIDLLMGLESLHQHASMTTSGVFGGLSPDSVLVSRKGTIKLCDALVASRAASLEGIGSNIEKLGYAAPEQVASLTALAPQCDLFAAGAVLWELLTGRRLLAGTRSTIERRLLEHDLPSLSDGVRGGPAISARLAAIVDGALAAEPRERPESARAMAEQPQHCGHPVASREQVAQLVAALSGSPKDPRAARLTTEPLASGLQTARQVTAGSDNIPPSTERRSPSVVARIATRSVLVPVSSLAPGSTSRPALAVPRPVPSSSAQLAPPRAVSRRPTHAQPSVAPRSPAPRAGDGHSAELEPSQVAAAVGVQSEPPPPAVIPSEVAPPESTRPQTPGPTDRGSWKAGLSPALGASERSPRTMLGLGLPAPSAPLAALAASPPLPALASLQDEPLKPSPPPATRTAPATPPAAGLESAFRDEEPPLSSSTLRAFSLPPPPVAPLAEQALWRVPVGAAGGGGGAQRASWVRRGLTLGLIGGALGGAIALGSALPQRAPDVDEASLAAGAALGLAAAAREDTSSAALDRPAAAEVPAPLAQAENVGKATTKNAAAPPTARPFGQDFHGSKLGDGQLAEAFALERRRDVPACSERLGEAAARYTGNQPQQSRFHFNAARRALQHGQLDTAHTELCAATAQDPGNLDAHQSLAELALDLGDPARAKEAAERGLARAPKNTELLGLLGDALALSGDIAESRRVWLGILGEAISEGERQQRLAVSYQKAGERALAVFDFPRARSYFRRALILTEGAEDPSLGLSDALLWLDQGRAGLAWAERAARAAPESARAQILLGDAYAKVGDLDSARAAWREAQRREPANPIAARRLSRGPR